jgi:hypothetical protein
MVDRRGYAPRTAGCKPADSLRFATVALPAPNIRLFPMNEALSRWFSDTTCSRGRAGEPARMCSPQGETSGSERGKSNGPIKDEKMARSPGAAPGELGFGDPAAQAGALRI